MTPRTQRVAKSPPSTWLTHGSGRANRCESATQNVEKDIPRQSAGTSWAVTWLKRGERYHGVRKSDGSANQSCSESYGSPSGASVRQAALGGQSASLRVALFGYDGSIDRLSRLERGVDRL